MRTSSEPYRLFFPLGILMAIAGVIPWIAFYFGVLESYPIIFHSRLMFHGFLMAFISGFLMTAVPKMSGTNSCRPFEAQFVLILILSQLLTANVPTLSSALFSLQSFFLLFFVLRRFFSRQQNPPSSFLFVPIGLISAVLGGVLLTFGDSLPSPFHVYGKLLVFQSFVLNLIIGLGSRLIPVLSRAPNALSPLLAGKQNQWVRHIPLLLLFNVSFIIEAFIEKYYGIGIRALTLTLAAVINLRIFSPMRPLTILGVSLRISAAFLFVPYYLILFAPAYELHWLHLTYIGGLTLMTLMVAVRVILSHGNASLQQETWSLGIFTATVLLIISTFVRTIMPAWFPSNSVSSFALAALIWIGALLFWIFPLARYIERPMDILKRTNG